MAPLPDGLIADDKGYLRLSDEHCAKIHSKEKIEESYDIEREPFARGKKAVVRRCRRRSDGTRMAAKYLKKRSSSSSAGGIRGSSPEVQHEIAVLHACAANPHVVRLHAVHETNDDVIIMLELGVGGELQVVLDRDEVPAEPQVVRVMSQVLQALLHLHDHNIVHLDLKPQNIVLTGEFPDCDVKLCDFGISKYLYPGSKIREILGTPDYVAPEVLNYDPISLATDMWSVGVLMYVLLSGCSPFAGEKKKDTYLNISLCRLDFPDELFKMISSEAKDLMSKLMVLKPSARLTARECLRHPWFTMNLTTPEKTLIPVTSTPVSAVSTDSSQADSSDSTETLVDTSNQQVTGKLVDKPRRGNGRRLSERFESILKSISDREEEERKTTKKVQVTRVDSFRSMTRANGMQTMPITGFLKYASEDTSHKFRRVYIVEDSPSPPISLSTVSVSSSSSGFASADSSCDSNSEISLDSSSDRSSIISLDDSLEFGFKGLSQRHYSSCYNVSELASPRECRGSVAKALSRLPKTPLRTKLTVFNERSLQTGSDKKKPGLELMKERKGNLVIIREVKTVTGSRFVRTSELKCESVQSRIRKFDPKLKLDISSDSKPEVF